MEFSGSRRSCDPSRLDPFIAVSPVLICSLSWVVFASFRFRSCTGRNPSSVWSD